MTTSTNCAHAQGRRHSSTIWTASLALAAALTVAPKLTAATPAVVWDGDFTASHAGFTLNRSGNALSQDNSTITIDQH